VPLLVALPPKAALPDSSSQSARSLAEWPEARRAERSGVLCEDGLQPFEIIGPEDESVPRGHVDEVEIDTGLRNLAGQVGEHTRPVFDVDDDHLPLPAHAKVRDRKRMLHSFGVRHQDVQLDVIGRPETRCGGKVDACVTHSFGDLSERAGLVLDLDD
jgi:hypothetical protein